MPQRRIDLSMRAILVRECGMTPAQTKAVSEHSWKRFFVQIVNVSDSPHVPVVDELELGRWSDSSLSHNRNQNPVDKNTRSFLISATRVSRIYVTNELMSMLSDLEVKQLK